MTSRSRLSAAWIVVTLVACSRGDVQEPATVKPAGSPASTEWIVAPDHVGPVTFGMTIAQAGAALNSSISVADTACAFTPAPGGPAGVRFMVINGRFARMDVESANVRTLAGARIGSTEDEIRSIYGADVRTEPSKYNPAPAHDLVVEPLGDPLHAMVFETDGKTVQRYRVGLKSAVQLVEGCG